MSNIFCDVYCLCFLLKMDYCWQPSASYKGNHHSKEKTIDIRTIYYMFYVDVKIGAKPFVLTFLFIDDKNFLDFVCKR